MAIKGIPARKAAYASRIGSLTRVSDLTTYRIDPTRYLHRGGDGEHLEVFMGPPPDFAT